MIKTFNRYIIAPICITFNPCALPFPELLLNLSIYFQHCFPGKILIPDTSIPSVSAFTGSAVFPFSHHPKISLLTTILRTLLLFLFKYTRCPEQYPVLLRHHFFQIIHILLIHVVPETHHKPSRPAAWPPLHPPIVQRNLGIWFYPER